jgi:hypothetical protein
MLSCQLHDSVNVKVHIQFHVSLTIMFNSAYLLCIQNPAKNILVESIFCNLSGGSSVGPSGSETGTFSILLSLNNNQYSNP